MSDRDDRRPPQSDVPQDLLRNVLARTSGSPCERAERLIAGDDADLDADDRRLLAGHVQHCEPCDALMRAMATLDRTLPTLAEVTPPADLLPDVLAATSHAPAAPMGLAGAARWLSERYQQLIARPRFGLELGYVGALLAWLLIGLPEQGSRPHQTLEAVAAAPVEMAHSSVRAATRIYDGAAAGGAWALDGLEQSTSTGMARTRRGRDEISATSRELGDAVASFDLLQGSILLGELSVQVVRLPGQLFRDEASTPATEAPMGGAAGTTRGSRERC